MEYLSRGFLFLMEDKFKSEILENETYLKKYSSIFNIVGNLKILFVITFIASIYFLFRMGLSLYTCSISILILMMLIILWVYHSIITEKVNYYKGIISINKKQIDRINYNWDKFNDIGEEFINIDHPYALDLDIVGKKSLFQFINSTNTYHGREAFANDLLNPKYTENEILSRQEAISELSKNIEFSNKIQYYLQSIKPTKDVLDLVNELKDDKIFIKSKIIKNILKFLPILTISFGALVLVFEIKNLYYIASLIEFFQCALWVIGIKKITAYLGAITSLPYKLNSYSKAIDVIASENLNSKKLLEIKSALCSSDISASKALKDLDKITSKINSRSNEVLYFVLNILLWWDYNCAIMLEDWKEKYSKVSYDWFLNLGELESLISFANLPNACDNMTMPIYVNEKNIIKSEEIGHPLIPNIKRINNDINISNNILIISGSNMSGKTTFLRTIGINSVLAKAGSFICSKKFIFSNLTIMTSMRISDDLNEGVSTFYAELKRIKSIVDEAKKGENILFLIDEIFRGTNSIDRLYGAKTVISKLNSLNVIGLISTHDLELCELASSRIKNYSFSESYKDKKIFFDYKIKQGKSQTTNAKHLMEMVGII